jgi:NAD(P)-dependent dehydrogenase (short-subunit alcohol dehydrogenase family)
MLRRRSWRPIALRRLGQTAEVAKAIWYLRADQSSYVNGAELHINGGQRVRCSL